MKIKYRCSGKYENEALLALIEEEGFKYSESLNVFMFEFFSDHPRCDEILNLVNLDMHPIITEEAIWSQKELNDAQWYLMAATRSMVESRNEEYTFQYTCKIPGEVTRYGHITQINPFVVKNMPTWKPKFNFASEISNFSMIFCSDLARDKIVGSGIIGIEFDPVLKGNLSERKENIHQLKVPNIIPLNAFDFVGEHKIVTCPVCGASHYAPKKPMGDNLRIKSELIPDGIDAFTSEMTYYEGFGERLIVVSKKIYNLIAIDMKERHVRFIPIG